jgi:hypothetical protein
VDATGAWDAVLVVSNRTYRPEDEPSDDTPRIIGYGADL